MPKLRLGINIDHIATIRNARCRDALAAPDVLRAAQEAIKGGADSITFHLREDRRHMLDADVKRLCHKLKVPVNLEMAATGEMKKIALARHPRAVCLVPEKRQEITTEGGLDVEKGGRKLAQLITQLAASGIRVSLFVNPDAAQILAAWVAGAAAIELHTGAYASSKGAAQKRELKRLQWAAQQAHKLGLEVHAGHGLTYDNVGAVAAIPEIVELNIGHFLVGEALFIGLAESVRRMRVLMNKARR
ncbi:MAG: pyridoxine 5'-phosphate synthase [Alphaproteobacteria bacterium]